MLIKRQPPIGDNVPTVLWEAHEYGAIIKSNGSMPCSICRAYYEAGNDVVIRNHFHISDLGACARKVFLTMQNGSASGISKAGFLMDGHLHEASILQNIEAGLSGEYRLKVFKNEEEIKFEIDGMLIIGHPDAILINQDQAYGIECKAVKDYNFRKIKGIKDKDGEISNDWYGQTQGYMLLYQLDRWYLIVKHRETSQILLPIRIDRDTLFIAKRLSKLKDIHTRLNIGMKQPDREEITSKCFQCEFCQFKEQCWNGE